MHVSIYDYPLKPRDMCICTTENTPSVNVIDMTLKCTRVTIDLCHILIKNSFQNFKNVLTCTMLLHTK